MIKNTIFVVSDQYLDACYKEAEKYEFLLQGYGNFIDAIEGLKFINESEILGYVVLTDSIKETKKLNMFLEKCNMISNSKLFLFALKDKANLYKFIEPDKYKNLRFSYVTDMEVVTDLTLDRDVFGTILIDCFEPYELKPKPKINVDFTPKIISYKALFPPLSLTVLKEPLILADVEQTIKFDESCKKLIEKNTLLYDIRRVFIYKLFKKCDSELEDKIVKEIAKVNDSLDFCLYNSLLKLAKEK